MKIQFEAGTSRHGDYGVNFLVSDNLALYAEIEVPYGASDDYGYLTLKDAIIQQAVADGVPVDSLEFWYDGQEQYLAEDASAKGAVQSW